jgi:hypothetical protein
MSKDPKLETMTKCSNVPKKLDSDLSFGFTISNFEIVSDFDIRISNLENKLGASKSPHPVVFENYSLPLCPRD